MRWQKTARRRRGVWG